MPRVRLDQLPLDLKSSTLPLSSVLVSNRASRYECLVKIYFSYFSNKMYDVGTLMNHLNEMVLLSTQNKC